MRTSAAHVRRGLLAVAAAVLAASLVTVPASSADGPGGAGVDTALPLTDSALTISGRGAFSDLEVTVNQTEDLVNQAVSVTWKGGEPTIQTSTRFAGNFLQIFQCWGDPDGTVPGNDGPPPEQCVQGASAGVPEGLGGGLLQGFTQSRIISRTGWDNHDEAAGVSDPRTSNVWLPFRAVDGEEIGVHVDPDFNPAVQGGNFWLNPYFNIVTTNEMPAAATGPDGTGAELIEVHTGIESSGLGCGQRVLITPGAEPAIPPCWLVVVPRGTAEAENVGTPFAGATTSEVMTSPVSPEAWKNRIAFPLQFNPVDSACSLADDDRRIVGTELVLPAVESWQSALCRNSDLPPYSYANVGDDSARLQLGNGAPGGPGMVIVSRPLDEASVAETNPVVYAPISLSGIVLGFTIERVPRTDAPRSAQDLAGVRVAELNLTPRVVAKLLTQSYTGQVPVDEPPDYEWMAANPQHLGEDADFLRFNPEFELLRFPTIRNFGGLILPAGNSDAAHQVWEWILADPEAKAWLDGAPDEWGMVVNPVYATTAEANANGLPFGDPVPSSFPKSDPYCFQGGPTGSSGDLLPPPLCGTDWLPYASGFRETARVTRSGEDGAKIVQNPFALSSDRIWVRSTPTPLGTRAILSLTDSASAARYGIQTARLSRAGDNGDGRTFVAPDAEGLTAGVASMTPDGDAAFLEPDPAADVAAAYPLTALTYAATTPLTLDDRARSEYAAFLDHARGDGQVPGLELGRLPAGYAPLTEALRAQNASAAALLRDPSSLVLAEEPAETPVPAPLGSAPLSSSPPPAAPADLGFVRPGSTSPIAAPLAPPSPTVVDAAADEGVVSVASGALTPAAATSATRFALPVLVLLAVASAWLALEVTKRPRRAVARIEPDPTPGSAQGVGG